MKKTIIALAILFLCLASLVAETNTYTITLVSKVERVMPQFELVSGYGKGDSVEVTTSRITHENVRVDFSIEQTNFSNYHGNILFTVSATQLSNGTDSTTGKSIMAFGKTWETLSFFLPCSSCRVPQKVADFSVQWNTREGMREGVYSAVVRLSTTTV